MEHFNIAVPAGIGDVSWIWSKLSTIKDATFTIYTPDTWPQRTLGWLKLLGPRVTPALGKFGYNDILMRENLYNYADYSSWKELLEKNKEEVIYLQPNQSFLKGKQIETWLPDLEMDYHYPMIISDSDKASLFAKMKEEISKFSFREGEAVPLLGIHMACLKGAKAWKAWLPEDWDKFFRLVNLEYPDYVFVLMGGYWDRDMADEVIGRLRDTDIKIINMIGKTNIAEAIYLLSKLNYYVGYSSGLNVMLNVLGKPCTTLWPDWQDQHMYCHVDPKMIEDGRYTGYVYEEPFRIFDRIATKLKEALYGPVSRVIGSSSEV